jgi:hypothetical protein
MGRPTRRSHRGRRTDSNQALSESPLVCQPYEQVCLFAGDRRDDCQRPDVEIVDSQTGDDLTRSVLVQIIAERHPEKIALFPSAMLHAMLRANALTVNFLQDYFRNSMAYIDYFQKHGASGPLEQPIHWMKAWLDKWPSPRPGDSTPQPTTPKPPSHDAQEIAERIAQLERRIAELEEEESHTR